MLYINGEWAPSRSAREFESRDPASGAVLGQVADAGREDVAAAIAAAEQAFPAWAKRTAYERSAILYRAWELMLERKEELAQLMTREQGKPIRMARTEVGYAADFVLWFAEEAKRVYGETIPSSRADQRFHVLRQPVGVAAAITPWNYPISMLTRKIAPALAAGCTIVVKPAEQTPLCAVETFKVFADAGVPAGVINLVSSSDPEPIGDELLSNPAVRKITFTGSTEIGKFIAGRAAEQMKRVSMELGGHAPFIVFPDADPVRAAKGAAAVKFLNTGQACISPNRIFVHRSIAETFLATLRERVAKLKTGHGLADGISVGPLIDEQALTKMQRQVDDAVSHGADVLVGGEQLKGGAYEGGYFWAPTVISGVTPEMLIYREETFGPIAPVIIFDDEEEVIRMANDTTYGLASYIYTNDLSRAYRVAEALDFGMIGINDINPTSAAVPFGGVKESGLGREGAREGLSEYLNSKVLGIAL
ncbi:NAD-dependent succinate-semialdehyde dehydrogenase [Streptosporangium sp. NPDC002544]|uniref:NAD-dependent succinate-semialdehyde dehydrogenase n=1 Tax=Streptosporangium sp. NPDC002544 TaxID=3154538 RepID=UPI0033241E81